MDDTPEQRVVDEVVAAVGPVLSIADQLRQRYEENKKEQFTEIDIPGFGGTLVGRYKMLTDAEIKTATKRVEKIPEGDKEIIAAIDQVSVCCDSLWARDDDGKLVPLLPDDPTPVRYDERLATFLGFEATKVREIVRKVFQTGGKFNVPALTSHAIAIGEWMQDVSSEVDTEFEGE